MATARARILHEQTGHRVLIVTDRGNPQWWSEVWDNNPRIARSDGPRVVKLVDCSRCRVYIADKNSQRFVWRRWDIRPGEIYLSDAERAFAAPYAGCVFIEPNTKVRDGNKSWPFERWQQVADRAGVEFIQCGPGPYRLKGVRQVSTTFRQAAAILAVSRAYVGTEGAMHHAAAALNVPAVVLWSHFIDPQFTGYSGQRNIRHAEGWCGLRVPCPKCKESMLAISVDEVLESLETLC